MPPPPAAPEPPADHRGSPRAIAPALPPLLEDLLRVMHENEYLGKPHDPFALAGAIGTDPAAVAEALAELLALDLATYRGSTVALTPGGRQRGAQIVRAHRLYETYLATRTGVPAPQWHTRAHIAEHAISAARADELARELSNPRFDPHGDPIPTRAGLVPELSGLPLADWPLEQPAKIIHIEDEPPALFAQIEALGLAPGMRVWLTARAGQRLGLIAEGLRLTVAPALAAQIRVAPLSADETAQPPLTRLSTLRQGDAAVVAGLSPACRGAERRRLLDLGLVPGTRITRDFASPFGSPVSYRLRGTLIGLRRAQSDNILIDAGAAPATAHEGP